MKWTFIYLALFVSSLSVGWTTVGSAIKGWASHTITIETNLTLCGGDAGTVRNAIVQAIDVWNAVPTSDLKLNLAASDSSITVAEAASGGAPEVPLFICDSNIEATLSVDADSIPGTTRLTASSDGSLATAAIFINATDGASAAMASLTAGQILVVMAHELGHALGLGHSSDSTSLMYFSIAGKQGIDLSLDDQDGLSFLYPKSDFQGQAFGCASTLGTKPSEPLPILICFALGIIVVFVIRRRMVCLP